MAGFLGAAAGAGMLILVGVLAAFFLRQIGVLKGASARQLFRTAAAVILFFCLDTGVAALICRVLRGTLDSPVELKAIFVGRGMQSFFHWLKEPACAPLPEKIYFFPAHWLGSLLFGPYLLGGVVLSLALTGCALHLIWRRVRDAWGDAWAEDIRLMLLSLPGSVFLLLPGWPAAAFLLTAILFFFAGKRLKCSERKPLDPSAFGWVLAGLSLLSCAVIAGMVYGRIG